jgi:hypothetical protein
MSTQAENNAAQPADKDADTIAAYEVLARIKERLECLAADVGDLMKALNEGPGAAIKLAAELLDDPDS